MKLYLLLISLYFFSYSAALGQTPQKTIYKSGVYHLNQDILGTLIIDAEEVYIEMNGFSIDALQADYGIVAHGHSILHINNGSIKNSSHTGIYVTDYAELQVSNITFENAHLTGLDARCIQELAITDCSFLQGDQSIVAVNIENMLLKKSFFSNNILTLPSSFLIAIDYAKSCSLEDVTLANNHVAVKYDELPQGEKTLLNIGISENVSLQRIHCTTNFGDTAFTEIKIKDCYNVALDHMDIQNSQSLSGNFHSGLELDTIKNCALNNITLHQLAILHAYENDSVIGVKINCVENGTISNIVTHNIDCNGGKARGLEIVGSHLNIQNCTADTTGSPQCIDAIGVYLPCQEGLLAHNNYLSSVKANTTISNVRAQGMVIEHSNCKLKNCTVDNVLLSGMAQEGQFKPQSIGFALGKGPYIALKNCVAKQVSCEIAEYNDMNDSRYAQILGFHLGNPPIKYLRLKNCGCEMKYCENARAAYLEEGSTNWHFIDFATQPSTLTTE